MNYTLFDIIVYNTINYLDFKSLVALISTNKQVLNIVEKNINNLNKGLANKYFQLCCENDCVIITKILLNNDKCNLTVNNNYAIRWASQCGYLSVVELLLKDKRVNPSADDNFAIQSASENGHLLVVERLLEDNEVDPSARDNLAIQVASCDGHLSIVERLLKDKRVDPSTVDNLAIRSAFGRGHLSIVKRLLKDKRVRSKLSNTEKHKYKIFQQ